VQDGLNNFQKSIKGARILLLGVAYKKDIDDWRESPALKVFELLERKGAEVFYNDPFVGQVKIAGKLRHSTPANLNNLKGYDCVVITTDHSAYNYGQLVNSAQLIIDTRNATQAFAKSAKAAIIKI
jgi:UDP-N-acetyl-D-glucosamine dehydrogenase